MLVMFSLLQPVLFRVIVGNQGVVAQIRESVTSAWVTACSLEHVHLHAHGFIGFTGHNKPGSSQGQPGHHPTGDQVVLHFVKMWSLDPLPPQHNDAGSPQAVHSTDGSHVATDAHAHSAHAEHYGVYQGHPHAAAYLAAGHSQM